MALNPIPDASERGMSTPTVLISGAGIAGLSLALFLQRSGKFRVRVFERAQELQPALGAHFGLNGALACLDRMGLGHLWKPLCHDVQTMRFLRLEDSNFAFDFDVAAALAGTEVEGRFGMFMRGELHRALANELPDGVLELGREIVDVDVQDGGDRVRVMFEDKEFAEGHILVATDGINSAVRRIALGDLRKQYSGTKMWLMVPDGPAEARHHHVVSELRSKSALAMHFPSGASAQNVVLVVVHAPEPSREDIARDSTAERFHEVFAASGVYDAGFTTEEQVRSASRLLHFGVYSMPPHASTWSSGRVCLLGDAIHATSPYMGQGANQAVQSAYCLARLLEERGVEEYSAVFRELHRIREPPTSSIIGASRVMASLRIPGGKADGGCFQAIKREIFYAIPRFFPKLFGKMLASGFAVRV